MTNCRLVPMVAPFLVENQCDNPMGDVVEVY